MAAYTPLLSDADADTELLSRGENDSDGLFSDKGLRRDMRRRTCFSFLGPSISSALADRTVLLVLTACAVSILSLLANIIVLHWNAGPSASTSASTKPYRYPNPYIGLESAVLVDPTPVAPIVNFPLLLAQVNSSDPGKVLLQTPHWDSTFGMIYPEDREVIITNEVSTIAQFRTLDFGMERCVATLELPSPADIDEANLPTKSVSSSNEPFTVEIWRLEVDGNIDPHNLSWNTRPARQAVLTSGIVDPALGASLLESPPFDCAMRTLYNFELRCTTPSCQLRFRQDHKSPRLAFFIVQHPTSNPGV